MTTSAMMYGKTNMKKLFVSVPMKGRTGEEIRASIFKMYCIAETLEGHELELVDSFIFEDPATENKNIAIWYLSKSLEKLSTADVFIGIENSDQWPGCTIEKLTAETYGIKCHTVPVDDILFKFTKEN